MASIDSPAHRRALAEHAERLFRFGEASRTPLGFGWLGDDGALEPARPVELWITCRMTHVYALAALLGRPGATELVDHGVAALTGAFADREHGGWFPALDPASGAPTSEVKDAYPHAFVILAASSAAAAGRPGARELLDEALAVSLEHFWDEAAGMVVESWDRTFTEPEAYRGINANMHTVEAYLAAWGVTRERAWLDRALRIVERALGFARANSWRLPEHFDPDWQPLLDYNKDAPAHPFRPYGATIGHWLEWARLTLHARAELLALGEDPPAWLLDDATALFDAAVREGWAADGEPGFVYTVDWDGRPVVRERMHWVLCEALGAAAALHEATGDERFVEPYLAWWSYAEEHFVDDDGGSWWHELSPRHEVSRTVWDGKADLYHAVQATLVPRLPLAPALAPALAAGLLRP